MKFINNPFFIMKTFKTVLIALAAALLFVSCTGNVNDPVKGTYKCTCDKDVSSYTGCGNIFNSMNDAVITAINGRDTRLKANDDIAVNAAAKVAEELKDQAETDFTVYVVFQEGNVMGENEKKPVILKSFNFKPVN